MKAYREYLDLDYDARGGGTGDFLANVIATRARPAKRLRGLINLLRKGIKVSLVSLPEEILSVDGKNVPFSYLENVK